MSACINVGEYSKAVELFEEFENLAAKKNTKLDSTLCNTALKAYAKLGEHAKALLLFSRMKSNNINRDIISFIALLSSCSKAGDWQEAEVLLEEINHSKWLSPNLEVYTLLISSCLRSNQTDRALEYFKIVCERSNSYQTALGNGETDLDIEMEATETRKNMRIAPPDACLLNILIPGIAHSQASLAIRLYDEMLASKLQPTQVTSVAIIQAIARSEDRKKALLIFYDAVKLGLFRQCRKDADVTHAPIEGSTFRLKLVDLDDAVVSTRLLGAVQYYKRIIGGSRVLKAPDLLFIVGKFLFVFLINLWCLFFDANRIHPIQETI
jgi:pentatricopeptide repeat domain-containing protein 1